MGAAQEKELHLRGLLVRVYSGGRGSDYGTWERSHLDQGLSRLVEQVLESGRSPEYCIHRAWR